MFTFFFYYKGDDLFYLDPHYSRPAIELKNIEDYTEEVRFHLFCLSLLFRVPVSLTHILYQELATFHCDTLRKIPISQFDPSMLLGFYCRTIEDFGSFCERINEVSLERN